MGKFGDNIENMQLINEIIIRHVLTVLCTCVTMKQKGKSIFSLGRAIVTSSFFQPFHLLLTIAVFQKFYFHMKNSVGI